MISQPAFLVSLIMDGVTILIMISSLEIYGLTKINKILLPIAATLIAISITVGMLLS